MIAQVCYALASDDTDRYAEMAFVNVSLLRRVHPEARVVLIVGAITEQSLRRRRAPVLEIVDEVIVLRVDAGPAAERSRSLKTRVRQTLTGPFLYLDVDALPIRRLDEIFATATDLAAAHDYPHFVRQRRFPGWVEPHFSALGWRYPLARYYNSGVVYWSDSARAREAGRMWEERYRQFRDQRGIHRDQPAFNSALDAVGATVHMLPVEYNAMVLASPWFARRARVFHSYVSVSGGEPDPGTLLGHLVAVWVREARIDWATVERAVQRSDPWVGRGQGLTFEQCMATGRRAEAARRIPKFVRRKIRELLGRPVDASGDASAEQP